MTWTRFSLTVWLVLLVPSLVFAKPEIRTALVIGNTLYALSPLISPVNDTDTIAKTLEKCNFTVIKKSNLTRDHMEQALLEFQESLRRKGGVGFFYFAGNGFQLNGINYLVPIDADPTNETEAASASLSVLSVQEAMKEAGNRTNIVVLDATYKSPFGESVEPVKPGFALMDAPDGFVIMSATQPDSVVADKTGRVSLFTAGLSQSFTTPETELLVSFKELSEDIAKSTQDKQVPWIKTSVFEPIFLYYPKLLFLNLLADIERFKEFSEDSRADQTKSGFQTRSGIESAWQSLLGFYPWWASMLKSEDPIDLIVIALNENPGNDLYKLTQLFNIALRRTNSLGMDFAYIPPGKFVMGSPFDEPGRGEDENQKNVTIGSGYFMQTTEVTQAQWMAVMERNPSNFDECGPDCPVESVSWLDVKSCTDRCQR